ncbi:MAG: hypothetical protein AAFX76_08590, partial [Planctomycetota bacterium]
MFPRDAPPNTMIIRIRSSPLGWTRALAVALVAWAGVWSGCESPEIGDEPVLVEFEELPPGVADAYRRLTGPSAGLAERAAAAQTLLEID